jgi:hypothetical protein
MLQYQFFLRNYKQAGCARDPDLPAILVAVYGFVPIRFPLNLKSGETDCVGGALKDTSGFKQAIERYCILQYNYLDPLVPPRDVFNPYTKFIHETLGSSAYAFSIDDEQSFRRLEGFPGVIIALGGVEGLDDTRPTPLPTKDNFRQQCKIPQPEPF